MHRKVKCDGMMKENKATEIALHHMDREIDVHSYLLATLSWGLLFIYFVHFFFAVRVRQTNAWILYPWHSVYSFFFFFSSFIRALSCIVAHECGQQLAQVHHQRPRTLLPRASHQGNDDFDSV